jgi:hypothetical protein
MYSCGPNVITFTDGAVLTKRIALKVPAKGRIHGVTVVPVGSVLTTDCTVFNAEVACPLDNLALEPDGREAYIVVPKITCNGATANVSREKELFYTNRDDSRKAISRLYAEVTVTVTDASTDLPVSVELTLDILQQE